MKKRPLERSRYFHCVQILNLSVLQVLRSENCNIAGLQAFGAVFDIEFDFLTLFQRAETICLNCCVVNENIFTFRL